MLIDGITLPDEADIERILTLDKRGPTFPESPSHGQTFQLTEAASGKLPGIFAYSQARGEWVKQTVIEENPYDIGLTVIGKPRPNVIICRTAAVRSFVIQEAFAESICISTVAADADTEFTLVSRAVGGDTDTVLGKITFAAGSNVGAFSQEGTGEILILRGEVLSVQSPEVQDAALRDLAITLSARLVVGGQ